MCNWLILYNTNIGIQSIIIRSTDIASAIIVVTTVNKIDPHLLILVTYNS